MTLNTRETWDGRNIDLEKGPQGELSSPVLRLRKLRPRKIKWLAKGHKDKPQSGWEPRFSVYSVCELPFVPCLPSTPIGHPLMRYYRRSLGLERSRVA